MTITYILYDKSIFGSENLLHEMNESEMAVIQCNGYSCRGVAIRVGLSLRDASRAPTSLSS